MPRRRCPRSDLVIIPGGFSYGDYLRTGAIAARAPIMTDIVRRARAGLPVIGICNGFQILCEARLLPGVLMRNAALKFVCHDVNLRVENASTRFTRRYKKGQVIRVPVAHGEGNYFADGETLASASKAKAACSSVIARPTARFRMTPIPTARMNHIAGLVNEAGNVMGMMPHPEDHIDPLLGGTDGRAFFESALEAA